ncbi:hypothetical protein DFA_09372 [Cavenderia fasciculata]|uniref:Uncharacterized protein n=1 Tax=Cavenderia fasciculata TaxID=261658 RepID=F4Q7G0_CACFS|nr:uncharacterized protein DFA_09372 [Cavenderia fasciculata]EGG16342.1 hypothetical protein DFA_09372 [Cavenderia fasciculata]|eukprot:XP_004354726.1 hypothetical protein DFA_09372 [Cavenderia fasciculata]
MDRAQLRKKFVERTTLLNFSLLMFNSFDFFLDCTVIKTLSNVDNLKTITVDRGDYIQVRLNQIQGEVKYAPLSSDGLRVISRLSNDYLEEATFRPVIIGRIIRYVPQVADNNASDIIQNWFNHLPIHTDEDETVFVIDNLDAIVRLYTNRTLGNDYQHVAKVHNIINQFINTCPQVRPQEKEQLYQTWLFIKDSFKENWDNIPKDTSVELLNLIIIQR